MIEILTKIRGKIIIIVVQNIELYYFIIIIIIIYKRKEVPLSLFSYQMLASTFDSDGRSSYYKVFVSPPIRTESPLRCFHIIIKVGK